jgi:hypothetical protein
MLIKDLILFISLTANIFFLYQYSTLVIKVKSIEHQNELIQEHLANQPLSIFDLSSSTSFFIISMGVLGFLFLVTSNNNNFSNFYKSDDYHEDIINILKDVLNNTNNETPEFVFSELQTIILNQQKMLEYLESINKLSFLDSSSFLLADQLAYISTLQ